MMVELPPVPWIRECDVDLLVAELFATEPQFTAWLLHGSYGVPLRFRRECRAMCTRSSTTIAQTPHQERRGDRRAGGGEVSV